jgi:hypothetical protein
MAEKPVVKAAAKPARPVVKAAAKPARPVVKAAAKPAKRVVKAAPVKAAPVKAKPAKPAPVKAKPAPVKAKPAPVKAKPARPAPAARAPRAAATTPVPEPVRHHDVIGDAEERDHSEPVVPLDPPRPGPVAELLQPVEGRPPLLLRVLRGNWRGSLVAALLALLVTVLAAALATVTVLIATKPGGESLVSGTTAGRWVRYVCAAAGAAFGSPLVVTSPDFSGDTATALLFVPLTVTFLGLATLRAGVRRAANAAGADRLADAVRTAAVFGVGVAAVTAFGRWSLSTTTISSGTSEDAATVARFAASSPKALFWAFGSAFVVALLAVPQRTDPRWSGWLLALRGAVVGLGTGIVAGFGAFVALAYAYAGRVDATPSDATRLLPAAVAYAVNLGTAMFGATVGGEIVVPYGQGSGATLFSSWVPRGYLLLLLVPLVSVLAGAWSVTRRSGLPSAEAARACARMAVPATLLWLVLAFAGAARLSAQGIINSEARVGAVLWDALLVGLWFAVVGWIAGWLLGRRNAAPRLAPGHEAAYEAAFDQVETSPVP